MIHSLLLATTLLGNTMAAPPADSSLPATQSLLWKISGKGLQQPSYLYGTIHFICPADLSFSPATEAALKSSQALFLEVDVTSPEAVAKMREQMLMPGEYSFKSLLPEADYKQVAAYFADSVGMPMDVIDKMKPIVPLTVLIMKAVPCTPPASCEQALAEMAQAQQKSIGSLESVEEQMAVFDSIPDKDEAEAVAKMVKDMTGSRRQFSQLVAAYKRQDIEALYHLVSSSPDVARSKTLLVDKRNRNWIPVIEAQAKRAGTFFACGAGHLGGKEGVIALLRRAGYQVEAVR